MKIKLFVPSNLCTELTLNLWCKERTASFVWERFHIFHRQFAAVKENENLHFLFSSLPIDWLCSHWWNFSSFHTGFLTWSSNLCPNFYFLGPQFQVHIAHKTTWITKRILFSEKTRLKCTTLLSAHLADLARSGRSIAIGRPNSNLTIELSGHILKWSERPSASSVLSMRGLNFASKCKKCINLKRRSPIEFVSCA